MLEEENELEINIEDWEEIEKLLLTYSNKIVSQQTKLTQLENQISNLKTENNEVEEKLAIEKEAKEKAEADLKTEEEAKEQLEIELDTIKLESDNLKKERDARPNITLDKFKEMEEELEKLGKEKEKWSKKNEFINKKRTNLVKILKENEEKMVEVEKGLEKTIALFEVPPK